VDVHGLSKIGEHLLGATPASILLVGIAGFAAEQFLIFVRHRTAADPFVSFMNMDMIEFRHASTFLVGSGCKLRWLRGP
jgi:hypothetical protein